MIIYADMVADLFHYGHVRFLKRIKEKYPNDILIVGIHHDDEVENYKRIPIMSLTERVEVVEACKYVDKVIPNAPVNITEDYLQKHNIDIVIHAHLENDDERYQKMYEIPSKLNKFKRLEPTSSISTTLILERIKLRVTN